MMKKTPESGIPVSTSLAAELQNEAMPASSGFDKKRLLQISALCF